MKPHRIWSVILGIVLAGSSLVVANLLSNKQEKNSMLISSPSFTQNQMIPARHTCDAENVSPPLAWSGVPAGAKSLVLIVDDPDAPDPAAPRMTWVHWLLYNIAPDSGGLTEGVADRLALQGVNDWQRTGYNGPCPPIGKHRYFFKLYALDVLLPDMRHPGKTTLEKAMQGHVVARSELVGLYQRR